MGSKLTLNSGLRRANNYDALKCLEFTTNILRDRTKIVSERSVWQTYILNTKYKTKKAYTCTRTCLHGGTKIHKRKQMSWEPPEGWQMLPEVSGNKQTHLSFQSLSVNNPFSLRYSCVFTSCHQNICLIYKVSIVPHKQIQP